MNQIDDIDLLCWTRVAESVLCPHTSTDLTLYGFQNLCLKNAERSLPWKKEKTPTFKSAFLLAEVEKTERRNISCAKAWEKEIFQISDDVAEPASASLMIDFRQHQCIVADHCFQWKTKRISKKQNAWWVDKGSILLKAKQRQYEAGNKEMSELT